MTARRGKYEIQPGDNTTRWLLLGLILKDERARLIHTKIAWVILENFMRKKGNTRASVSFLQKATDLTRGSVAIATDDLVTWGYFERRIGSGKRPTEYFPSWFRVLPSPDANSVLQSPDEIVLQPQDAKTVSVRQPREQTPLQSLTYGETYCKDSSGDAVARQSAAPRAEEDFESIWSEYPVGEFEKARAAYHALSPTPEVQQEIVEGLRRWRGQYESAGRALKFRKALSTVLAKNHWREDGPMQIASERKPNATRTKQPSQPAPAKPEQSAAERRAELGLPPQPTGVRKRGKIVEAKTEKRDGDTILIVKLDGGYSRRFAVEAADEKEQRAGQGELASISYAAGDVDVVDGSELVGAKVVAQEFEDGSVEWEAAA